jgi:DNA topoisomerase-1
MPKDRDPKSLTLEECIELLDKAPMRGRRGKKKVAKQAPVKKTVTKKAPAKKKKKKTRAKKAGEKKTAAKKSAGAKPSAPETPDIDNAAG